MCSCGKKKKVPVEMASEVSVDPMKTVKVLVDEDTYYRSEVLNVPVILTSKKANIVFIKDLKILKDKGVTYRIAT